jgi:hypothetical protein
LTAVINGNVAVRLSFYLIISLCAFILWIQSSGDSGANVKRLEQETDTKIQHLKTEAGRISGDVVSILLKYVTTVKN